MRKPTLVSWNTVAGLRSMGRLVEEGLNVVENIYVKRNGVVLGSLLAACRTKGNVSLAERLTKYLVDLDPDVILIMSLQTCMQLSEGEMVVARLCGKRKGLGIKKMPGISSIEIGSSIHEFVAGDKSHIDTEYLCNARTSFSWFKIMHRPGSMGNKPAKQERKEILLKIVPPLDHAYVRWLTRDLERIHGFTVRNPRPVKPPDHYIEYMRLNGWLDVNLNDPDLAHLFK
ncbi:hypothetical protein QYF36_015103 [Acer negundo]|nr:hypothetical protein QYF36_015103 [Acer negundo]